MIQQVKAEEIISSWFQFSKEHKISSTCTAYPRLIDNVSRNQNSYCYPHLMFPDKIITQLNRPFSTGSLFLKNENYIYLDDIIKEAKRLDSSLKDIEYLVEPQYPEKPYFNPVSDTTSEPGKNYHLGCWSTLVISYIMVCLVGFFVFDSRLFGIALLPSFIYLAFGIEKPETTTRHRKLPKDEYLRRKEKAVKEYNEKLLRYEELCNSFEMRLGAYNRQQLLNMQRIAPLMDNILWRLCNKFRCIPRINTERATEIPTKGCSEDYLFAKLMEIFPNNIFIDMKVGPYFPDICLIIPGMIAIDIEIDEPYDMASKKETHYRGCGDEQRNEYFINNGWYVCRFSEEQVITNTGSCVDIINHLVQYF